MNSLLKLNRYHYESLEEGFDPAQNADEMAEAMSQLEASAESEEAVEELNEDIAQQEQAIESGEEIEVNDLVEAEAKFESFCQRLASVGANKVKSHYGMESFGNESVRQKYIINLRNKKALARIAHEEIQEQKISLGKTIKDFFTVGRREYQNYIKEMKELLDEVKSSDKNEIKDGMELSGKAMAFVATDLIRVSAENYGNLIAKKRDALKTFKDANVSKVSEWYVGEISNGGLNMIGKLKEGRAGTLNSCPLGFVQTHEHAKAKMRNDNATFTVYGINKETKSLTENVAYVRLSDLATGKLGIKSKKDVISAIEKIIDDVEVGKESINKVFGIFGQVKQNWTPLLLEVLGAMLDGDSGRDNGRQLGKRLGYHTAMMNKIAHAQVRTARHAFIVCKELKNLLK